jgi:hypothetical protein
MQQTVTYMHFPVEQGAPCAATNRFPQPATVAHPLCYKGSIGR